MGGRGAIGRGGTGGGGAGGSMTAEQKEKIQWGIDRKKSKKDSNKEVKPRIMGKVITTEKFSETCTGEIRFNSNGVNNILTDKHSSTSEKKWAVERLVSQKLKLSYEGFDPLNPGSHNLAKKQGWGYTGFNKYSFEYQGKTYVLGTAIVKGKYELPYYIGKK